MSESRWGDDRTAPYDPHALTVAQAGETVRFPQRDDSAQFTVAQPADTGFRPPESAPPYPSPYPPEQSYHPVPPGPNSRPSVPLRIGTGVSQTVPGRGGSNRRRWSRFTRLVSTLTTIVLVAAAGWTIWQWWHNAHDNVVVSAVAVAPAQQLGGRCDVQYDVVGTIVTNGKAGTITYEWLRSDGQTSGTLQQSVQDGQTSTKVHLYWRFTGQGSLDAIATLQIIKPGHGRASARFPYSCS